MWISFVKSFKKLFPTMKFGKKSAMLKFLGYIKNLSSTGLLDLGFDFFKQ